MSEVEELDDSELLDESVVVVGIDEDSELELRMLLLREVDVIVVEDSSEDETPEFDTEDDVSVLVI